jgi:hypothetical protein
MLTGPATTPLVKYDVKKYDNIILPGVLYGCETLSLTLRENID